jgi:hypothetical protein
MAMNGVGARTYRIFFSAAMGLPRINVVSGPLSLMATLNDARF